ncbi:MAG: VCBS repeat-containing protein [Fuerstiella sp.]
MSRHRPFLLVSIVRALSSRRLRQQLNKTILILISTGTAGLALVLLCMVCQPTVRPLPVRCLGTKLEGGRLTFRRADNGSTADARPRITNVNITDLDADGTQDLLICDAVRHTVWWWHRTAESDWTTVPLVPENTLPAPAHTAVVDIDADGDNDILVAILRSVWPTDSRTGQVVVLVNDGHLNFSVSIIADDLRRVTDVQPGDFDADGDIDLAVAEFGYQHGRVLWLENVGDGRFADHELLSLPGCIHVPVDDYDNDGDPDIAALISQNDEEVWIFENPGNGSFEPIAHRVWGTTDFDRGFAGMVKCDLDQDGDTDFLLSAGDNLELIYPCPQPGHGCIWLENRGNFEFTSHQIATLGGTYAADAADMDGDGDIDVVLASMFNDWKKPHSTSLAWLENDGHQTFSAWHIASQPTHLCTVSCGDLNGDGLPDIAAGSLQIYPPFDNAPNGVAIWENQDLREPAP